MRPTNLSRTLASPTRRTFPTLCRTCMFAPSRLQRRKYSSVTATATLTGAPRDSFATDDVADLLPASAASHPLAYKIRSAVLLSRPPLLTQELTPFEKSYFLYQRRLNERLALPFTRYFYYARGTPGDVDWKRKIKQRKSPARDIGPYNGYGVEAWNDEVLLGETMSEPDVQREALLRDADVEVKGRGDAGEEIVKRISVDRPAARVTEADVKADTRTLNRKLERTLYLIVKGKSGADWHLPSNELLRNESLHTAAERIIVQTGGIDMNTWVVGNMPIGHQIYNYTHPVVNEINGSETRGEKTFLMKARIMAGKADLKNNKFDLSDHQWLTKEEIQQTFKSREWSAIKNLLAER